VVCATNSFARMLRKFQKEDKDMQAFFCLCIIILMLMIMIQVKHTWYRPWPRETQMHVSLVLPSLLRLFVILMRYVALSSLYSYFFGHVFG
jgi:hypothetical protein